MSLHLQALGSLPANIGDAGLIPGLGSFPGFSGEMGRKWQPPPIFLPEKSHRQRSLVGYSPWGHKRAGYDLATKNNNTY